MSKLRLLGNKLVIAPVKVHTSTGGILLPGRHYTRDVQQWQVLQVGQGRLLKNGQRIHDVCAGDLIVTDGVFECHHEFTDGVRIVDATVALAKVEV